MDTFNLFVPTQVYFGEHCVSQNRTIFPSFGSRAFVITTKFLPPGKNAAMEDTIAALESTGITCQVCDEVEENPSVENELYLTQQAKKAEADFIVGIGGGSAIDAAKGIGILISRLDEDPYDVFFGHGSRYEQLKNMSSLPVVAIPTTAGSGSEMTPNLILTRTVDGKKQCVDQKSYATAALLDPVYIATAPDSIFYSGVLDALAHNIESYINRSSTIGNRLLAETGFSLFRSFKDNIARMDRDGLTMEDYGNILLHSTIAGVAVGMNGSSLPHGMGYPLSHEKGQYHGYASCICLPSYLEHYGNSQMVSHVLNLCGFLNLDEFADFINMFVQRFMKFTVTQDEIIQLSREFSNNPNRMMRHPGIITYDDILEIYTKSLSQFIV